MGLLHTLDSIHFLFYFTKFHTISSTFHVSEASMCALSLLKLFLLVFSVHMLYVSISTHTYPYVQIYTVIFISPLRLYPIFLCSYVRSKSNCSTDDILRLLVNLLSYVNIYIHVYIHMYMVYILFC